MGSGMVSIGCDCGKRENNIQTICVHPKNGKAANTEATFHVLPQLSSAQLSRCPAIRVLQWLTTAQETTTHKIEKNKKEKRK